MPRRRSSRRKNPRTRRSRRRSHKSRKHNGGGDDALIATIWSTHHSLSKRIANCLEVIEELKDKLEVEHVRDLDLDEKCMYNFDMYEYVLKSMKDDVDQCQTDIDQKYNMSGRPTFMPEELEMLRQNQAERSKRRRENEDIKTNLFL